MSGGQKQRLALALALVSDPELFFLDEPTTGLDPQSRRQLWELMETFRTRGRTVLITTHYMEEAERLCDRVAIVDHGKVIALGPVNDPAWTYGLGILKVDSEEELLELQSNDPAILLGNGGTHYENAPMMRIAYRQ